MLLFAPELLTQYKNGYWTALKQQWMKQTWCYCPSHWLDSWTFPQNKGKTPRKRSKDPCIQDHHPKMFPSPSANSHFKWTEVKKEKHLVVRWNELEILLGNLLRTKDDAHVHWFVMSSQFKGPGFLVGHEKAVPAALSIFTPANETGSWHIWRGTISAARRRNTRTTHSSSSPDLPANEERRLMHYIETNVN